MSARIAEAEPGVVAIEWPVDDLAPEFLAIDRHAALVTAARREAERLGLSPGGGSCTVRRAVDPLARPVIRFAWGEASRAEKP